MHTVVDAIDTAGKYTAAFGYFAVLGATTVDLLIGGSHQLSEIATAAALSVVGEGLWRWYRRVCFGRE